MSDANARREARIRKILENSENRLKRIVNSSSDISNQGEHQPECPSDFITKDVSNQRQASLENIDDQTTESLSKREVLNNDTSVEATQLENQRLNSDLRTIYQNPVPASDSVSEVEFDNLDEKSLLLRNWVIIFIALTVRYLFLISEQYAQIIESDVLIKYNINKIFIPFFVFEITEFIFFRPSIPETGILNILLMLNMNLQTQHIHKIIICFRIISRIVRDLMVYFFTFTCFDQILNFVLQEEQQIIKNVP